MSIYLDLLQINLQFLSQISPNLFNNLSSVQSSVEIEEVGTADRSVIIDNQCLVELVDRTIDDQWQVQWESPDRVLMARISNETVPLPWEDLLPNIIDSEEAIALSNLPNLSNLVYREFETANYARDIVLIGSLSLLFMPRLLQEQQPLSIVLVESDLKQLAAVFCLFNFKDFIEKCQAKGIGFHLIYENDQQRLEANLLDYYGSMNALALHGLRIFRSPLLSPELIKLHSWLHAKDGWAEHVKGFLGNDTDEINQTMHAVWNTLLYPHANLLKSDIIHDDYPLVIVASGPSLDEQIEWLQTHHTGLTIISAGSAIGALLRAGIHVDGAVLLEMGSVVFRDLSELLIEGYDLSAIALFASITIDPRIASQFKQVVFFHRPLSSAYSLFSSESCALLPQAGPQAANAALEVALQLGSRRLLLLGCDFAAPSSSNIRAANAIGQSLRAFDLPVPGRLGKTVFSSAELMITRLLFENALSIYGVSATSLGSGSVLKGVRAMGSFSDLDDFDQYLTNREDFQAALSKLPERKHSASSVASTLEQAEVALHETTQALRATLSQAGCWSHALSKDLSKHINWEDSALADDAKLSRRLTRFLYFFIIQPLHDFYGNDPSSWEKLIKKADESLLVTCNVMSCFFATMRDVCIAKTRPVYDPGVMKVLASKVAKRYQNSII